MLAPYADEVMKPLTRPDDSRGWEGHFERLDLFVGAWLIEFERVRPRSGLLRQLESLAWPYPESVQVLVHDEDDDCFGLWMMRDGVLAEQPVPGHRRLHGPALTTGAYHRTRRTQACCGGRNRPCLPATPLTARTNAPPGDPTSAGRGPPCFPRSTARTTR